MKTATTEQSPFYANYRFDLKPTVESQGLQPIAQKASLKVSQITKLHEELQKDIAFLTERSAIYYNRHKSKGPTSKGGDKVYLRRNTKTTRPSTNLDYTKFGPFSIEKVK